MLRRFLGDRGAGEDSAEQPRGTRGANPPQLDVGAYALDSRLSARIALTADRLLEMLNEAQSIHLRDVVLESLVDGHKVSLPELDVQREELLAIAMVGPRGSEARRRATRSVGTALRIGPYRIWGLLHSVLSADAMSPLHGHRPMVPLTRVTIVYDLAGIQRIEELPGIIMNREAIEQVNEAIVEADTLAIALDRDYGILGRLAQPTSVPLPLPDLAPEPTATGPESGGESEESWT
jgi:hypothetical protein